MDGMNDGHSSDLSHAVHAQCDDTLTQDEQDLAHSSVRVDVLCVEDSASGHVVIGVGRVIVQRHHAIKTNY